MTGMTAVALCLAFNSCSHDTNLYDPDIPEKEVTRNYEEAFKKYVGGTISPNQNWGFDEDVAQARALTRTANPNANMWGETWEVPETLTTAQKKRVRLYFQYNKTPQNEPIDYKNFFVQDVYKGAGTPLNNGSQAMSAYSTEKYSFNNKQEAGSDHMDKLTAGSRQDHIYNYNDAKCSSNNKVWDGYSYETGWPKADASQAENFNHKKFHTDYIMLMENSKTDCFGWHETQGEIQHDDHYVIISAATIDAWADAHSELGDLGAPVTDKWNRNFVGFDYEAQVDMSQLYARDGRGNILYYDQAHTIPYLKVETNQYSHTIVPAGTPGAYPIKDRYVDNDQTKGNLWAKVGCADDYYSDWIVCITDAKTRGTIIEEPKWIRIIGEDLSATDASDFDFNDIVIDVKLTATGADCILQAAGGTLPLRINRNDKYEVHKLFGVNTDVMVNTNAENTQNPKDPSQKLKGASKTPVSFSMIGDWTNAKDIKIEVKKNDTWMELKAVKGEPAAKIAVETTFNWCNELVSIKGQYPLFTQWVQANHPGTVIWY